MTPPRATLDDHRSFYAAMMAAASRSADARLLRIFEAVPREAFLPVGPWHISINGRRVETPTPDPAHLYQNVLVVLDASQGINNGEPLLHAGWIGAAAPQPGETVTHIGAGTGYYSAILSMLVLPGGRVNAIEIHAELAEAARRNLTPFENVAVIAGNAVELPLPPSDLIYVNAAVVAPPSAWLAALLPGGRPIFPWRPTEQIGMAALITRHAGGFAFKPLMHAGFISCIGAAMPGEADVPPSYTGAWETRSVHLTRDRQPDQTATAVYSDLWFSSAAA